MVVRLSCSILHKNSTLFFLVGLSFEFMKLVVIWDELMNNHQISINWILMEFEWMKWIEWQLKNISKELAFHGHPLLVDIRAADSKESATFLSLSLSFLFFWIFLLLFSFSVRLIRLPRLFRGWPLPAPFWLARSTFLSGRRRCRRWVYPHRDGRHSDGRRAPSLGYKFL